jgi:hypothetical protein
MCWVLTCLFHSFLEEKLDVQPYPASGQGKARRSSAWMLESVLTLGVFEDRRDFFSDLTDSVGLGACESLRIGLRRFIVRLELLLDVVDLLRLDLEDGL